MIDYRIASLEDLETIWDTVNIADHPGDDRWVKWKKLLIEDNLAGKCRTFVIVIDGKPVGEGTLLLSPDCFALAGLPQLADGTTTNINGLRIRKQYEGNGYISRLVKFMENWAHEQGYSTINIGVSACEARNLAIYLHWGYTEFLCHEIDEGELVLYYAKAL